MYEGEVGGNTIGDYQNPVAGDREEQKEDGGSGGTNQIEENPKQKKIDKKLIFGGKGKPQDN